MPIAARTSFWPCSLPLAAISSGVQLVKTVQGRPASSIKDMIEQQTKHLTQLMDDLLDVSHQCRQDHPQEKRIGWPA